MRHDQREFGRAWFSVDILEADGNMAHESYCASDGADATTQAWAASHRGPRDEVQGAYFDKRHLENRRPESRCRTYHGRLLVDGSCWVYSADEKRIVHDLKPRLDLVNHSPDGFAWGYSGSGPAQLSLALLADALGDDERALHLHEPFKSAFIETQPQDKDWLITEHFIGSMADQIEQYLKQNAA